MRTIGLIGTTITLALTLGAPVAAAPLSDAQDERLRTVHLLNRAAFGPTPALLEEVLRVGRQVWLSEQLRDPSPADPALEARLAVYPALEMDSSELIENYPRRSANDPSTMGIGRPQRVPIEVTAASVTRAVHARAQLREVLTDFWFNHFNVTASNNFMRLAVVSYVRDTIRPNALGYFEDLLRATAQSPAMLYYLDNYRSVAPGSRGRYSGLNENYARELLELHTVGVDGGYSQEDVLEVARAFTGWTFTPPRTGEVTFDFRARDHVRGPKKVLGKTIAAGDESEGLEILRFLATHPSTAEFLAHKLVERFVSDDPPAALVARTAEVFLASGGHIGWTLASLLTSDEFDDPAHRGNKAKSPLEVVASTLRAFEADVSVGIEAARWVDRLGQPLLGAPSPAGWPETADGVLSPGGMVGRFTFAHQAATGAVPGTDIDADLWRPLFTLWGTEGLAHYLLGRPPGATTRAALETAARSGAQPGLLAALVLAGPEFQLH